MNRSKSDETPIGRERLLADLGDRVAALTGGTGAVVFVAGEAGIGKSTLARALSRQAESSGAAVAWGRCREDRAAPQLEPWLDVASQLELDVTVAFARSGRADPDLHASARFRRFEALREALRGAGPACLILEDIHRADTETVALIAHLAETVERDGLLIVATMRDSEIEPGSPAARLIAEYATSPACSVVTLDPLTPHESRQVALTTAGHLLGSELIDDLVLRADGNPFFLVELLRDATDAGPARHAVPRTIREVIVRRVQRLPEPAARALAECAVAGRAFAVHVAASVLDCSPELAAERLEPAVRASLLRIEGSVWSFSHVLVRDVLYDSLDVATRRTGHLRLAALSSLRDASALIDAAEHARAAHALGAPIDLATVAVEAARSATAAGLDAEAVRWYDVAADASEVAPSVPRSADVELSLECAEARLRFGDVAGARRAFTAAAEAARALGLAESLAQAALGVGRCVVTAGAVDWDLVALLEEAETELARSAAVTALQARLLARRGIELYWRDGAESRRLTEQAEAMLAPETIPAVRAEVLFGRLFCLRGPGRLDDRRLIGAEVVTLAERHRLDDALFRGYTWLVPEHLQAADLPAYDATITALTRIAEQSRQPLHLWYARLYQAQAAIAAGTLTLGQRLADESLAHGRRSLAPVAEVYHAGQEYLVRRELGGLDAVLVSVERLSSQFPAFATLRALLALASLELGMRERAVGEVTRLAHNRFASVPQDSLWMVTVGLCGEVAFRANLPATGQLVADLLAPYQGTVAVQGLPCNFGAVDRYIGLAASAAGRHDLAVRALRTAVELHQSLGFVPFGLRSEWELVEATERRGGRALPSSRASLARIAHEARERGYLRLAGLVEDSLELRARIVSRPQGPGGQLTAREAEVLALVAGGSTNRDLAQALSLSINTIERHLRNLYTKLGVANRAEAVAAHFQHLRAMEDHGLP